MDYSFRYQNRIPTNSDKGRIKINPQGLLIKLFRLAHGLRLIKPLLLRVFFIGLTNTVRESPLERNYRLIII